jgi:uncharacterized protein
MALTVEFDVGARMRDGVILRANVYRPDGPGPWPVLLARMPYGKDLSGVISSLDPVQATRRGFVVVIQDTRGRFASDGEWDPFRFERQDGYDTVEWAARLPGSNGRVGMFGASYLGNAQWLAAMERPPSLAALAPALTWAEPMDGLFARGGAVELGLTVSWSLQNGIDYLRRLPLPPQEISRRADGVIDEYDGLGERGYWDLPVSDIATLRRHGVPDLGGIRALDQPGVASRCRVAGAHARASVPTFHTAGWHDIFLQGTLDNYMAMTALGRDARLIVGPWTHMNHADPIGELSVGARAARAGAAVHPYGDINDLHLSWFRRYLGPEPGITLPDAPVRIFVMGRNEWRDEACWPPPRAEHEAWYLRADGTLTRARPGAGERPSEYVYDPKNPVPTVGGQTVMSPGFPAGPRDQSRIEARDDVLTFTSEPLQQDLEVTGPVRVVLHAESSAPSTDWVARLCDVHPDGRSFNLCDGILRIAENATERERREIDLWSTSNVFLRGHRVRVHVTSSSFPRWDRNLNTGKQRESDCHAALQRLCHDIQHASFIELPVIQ